MDKSNPHPQNEAKNKSVIIPKTPLGAELEEAAAIKQAMTELLRELEQTARINPSASESASAPGSWRHHKRHST